MFGVGNDRLEVRVDRAEIRADDTDPTGHCRGAVVIIIRPMPGVDDYWKLLVVEQLNLRQFPRSPGGPRASAHGKFPFVMSVCLRDAFLAC